MARVRPCPAGVCVGARLDRDLVEGRDLDEPVSLEAGYRSDVLVKASAKPGTYLLTDAPTSATIALRGVAEDPVVLAEVVVGGDPIDMGLPTDGEMKPLAYRGETDLR